MADSAEQITALVYRYCELFDTGQFDEFAAQFEHGRWHRAEPGAAAARRWIDGYVHLYDGLPRTKHLTTNLTVEVDHVLGAVHGDRDPDALPMDAMIDYALGPQAWADEVPAWQAAGGTILSIQTMQSGTGYQRVSHGKLDRPAAHIAALGEFSRVMRDG